MRKWTKAVIIYNLSIIALSSISDNDWLSLLGGVFLGGIAYLLEDDD